MNPAAPLLDLAIALGLGLIVGLQRQHASSPLAGLRTFPLITMLGFAAALLGPVPLAAAVAALALVIAAGAYLASPRPDSGVTTEIATLLMFSVGALLAHEHRLIALAIGSSTAVLLEFKGELHGLAARLSHDDLRAIMRFVLLSLVVLPALPDRAFGPFAVLNPRQIWWMVVLVVGIDLAGYLLAKFRPATSTFWQGLLGGLISSTATAAAYARRTRAGDASPAFAALVIALASAVVFVRVAGELATVCWPLWSVTAAPLITALAVSAAAILWFWRRTASEQPGSAGNSNPTELAGALWFAGLYSAVLIAAAAVRHHLGDPWLALVSIVGGLTDVDAITLSTAQLVNQGHLSPATGARLVVLGVLANLGFKLLLAAWLGGFRLASRLSQILLPVSLALLIFWLWL